MYLNENIVNILWKHVENFGMNLIVVEHSQEKKTLYLIFCYFFQNLNHSKWIKTNIIMKKTLSTPLHNNIVWQNKIHEYFWSLQKSWVFYLQSPFVINPNVPHHLGKQTHCFFTLNGKCGFFYLVYTHLCFFSTFPQLRHISITKCFFVLPKIFSCFHVDYLGACRNCQLVYHNLL
jgi:hypothetical protein